MTYDEYLAGRVIVTGEKIHSVTGRSGSGNWEDARFTEKEFKIIRMVEPSIIKTLEDIHSGMEAGSNLGGGLMSKAYNHANGFKDDFMEYTGSYFRFRVGHKWVKDVTLLPSKMALISETTNIIKSIGYNKVLVENFISKMYDYCLNGSAYVNMPIECMTSEGSTAIVNVQGLGSKKESRELGVYRKDKPHGNSLYVASWKCLEKQLEESATIDAVVDNAFIWDIIHNAGYKYPLEGKYVRNL